MSGIIRYNLKNCFMSDQKHTRNNICKSYDLAIMTACSVASSFVQF